MKIVVAGGTGQVGMILAKYFYGAGHQVVVLSRHRQNTPWQTSQWDGATLGAWMADADDSDGVLLTCPRESLPIETGMLS